eukprot:scaffold188831_cov31-Tisochrysis_lutea.AAC.1
MTGCKIRGKWRSSYSELAHVAGGALPKGVNGWRTRDDPLVRDEAPPTPDGSMQGVVSRPWNTQKKGVEFQENSRVWNAHDSWGSRLRLLIGAGQIGGWGEGETPLWGRCEQQQAQSEWKLQRSRTHPHHSHGQSAGRVGEEGERGGGVTDTQREREKQRWGWGWRQREREAGQSRVRDSERWTAPTARSLV